MATNASASPPTIVFPFPLPMNKINEDYDLVGKILGVGVNGRVYECQHRATGKTCALKILPDTDATRREVILHKKACENCPYIVQLLDVYQEMMGTSPRLLIVMECMKGGELFKRIQKRRRHPYSERDAAKFIDMIVKAVAHLHAMDIAHRDLKPENLLFASTESDALLKLCDFGFAKEGHNAQLPLLTPCYTAYYVAPEILSHTRYNKACDIWSLGVIMYILLSGTPPFYSVHGDQISDGMKNKIGAAEFQFTGEEWNGVSEEAKATIKRMLVADPAERITIEEVLACAWLHEPASDREINVNALRDEENLDQIENELRDQIEYQRPPDRERRVNVRGPGASRIARRRAARK